jgi:periplasmic protein TonB
MSTRHLIFGVALAVMLTPAALMAAKKKSASTPPTPAPARADTAVTRPMLIPVTVTPGSVSRTAGPTITPGSPIEDRTTIAPFPLPGDTSRAAIAHARLMNVPREGVTALEPLPPSHDGVPQGTWWKGLYVPYKRGSIAPPEQVDVLPERLMEPIPVYPKAAIDAGIQGIVPVMARVLADGTVGETHVMRSIPALDDAAVQAVKRMRFKPASYQGKPVAVWVGVPVRFTLH